LKEFKIRGEFMPKESQQPSRWVTPLAWLIGLVFIAAAFLKAWDIRQFALQISYYKLLPGSLDLPAAFLMVALEAFIGICLITGFQRTLALGAGAGLLVLFLAATGFRWNELQGHDCGCFGSFDRGGPASVLWQDTLLLLMTLVTFKYRRRTLELAGRKIISVVITLLCLGTATYSEMDARSKVSSIDQTTQGQLNLIIYLSATCPHCIANSERLNLIGETPNLPPIQTYLGAETDAQIFDFLNQGHLRIPYTKIPFSYLWLMTKSVPVLELRRGDSIVARWDGDMPTPEEVLKAVAAARTQGQKNSS
jgi:uncharacterized membrane protein YphA (DoxX/SURF4 family)